MSANNTNNRSYVVLSAGNWTFTVKRMAFMNLLTISRFNGSHSSDMSGISQYLEAGANRHRLVAPLDVGDAVFFNLTMRLASRLGIPITVDSSSWGGIRSRVLRGRILVDPFRDEFKAFVRGIVRIVDTRNIPTNEPFTALDDGTYWELSGPRDTYIPADPRLDKVKRFLRRHLRREPTDKDIDTFIYFFFGSNAFRDEYNSGGLLFRGLQNSHYNRNGRHYLRNSNNRPASRRDQRRIVRWRRNGMHHRHGYGSTSNTSNSNSTDSNTSNSNSTDSNSNNSNTSTQYARNKSRLNANKAKNKSYKNSITWEEHTVNNLPEDLISFEPFSNGQKAIKIDKYNRYYSPQTFRTQARMSMTDAFNKHGNAVLFKHPMTRQNVRRSNIKFVILKNKNTGRATRAKKNAANKIGDARRRQLTRRTTLARAKAVTAALKRKRSQ